MTGPPVDPGYSTNAGGMSALELMARQLYALRAQVDGLLAAVMREVELERLRRGGPVGEAVSGERSGSSAGAEPGSSSHPEINARAAVAHAASRVLSRADLDGRMPSTFGGPKPADTTDPVADPQHGEGHG